jgi:hypothetical protein
MILTMVQGFAGGFIFCDLNIWALVWLGKLIKKNGLIGAWAVYGRGVGGLWAERYKYSRFERSLYKHEWVWLNVKPG